MPDAGRVSRVEVALRIALWLLLGGWIGSWASFGVLVAPTAFRVLPSTEIAGQLVAPVLTALHFYGAVAGVLLALVAFRLRRRTWLVILPLAMSAACLISQLAVTPRIEAIRPLAFGPGGTPEIAARFQHLHRVSVAIFEVVGAAALLLLGRHASYDASRSA
jgi:hypothetical protein